MQCCMSEHFCFSPHIPLSMGDVEGGDNSLGWNLSPRRLVESEASRSAALSYEK